ncbi:uncharacterized protein JCM15063_005752 [Sporobolomyces koalae]|uniref:uncharacterized protein n=1 Tax=Sporobolomyces koalae TaxID=500713 RepID=UPI0031725170
MTTPAGQFDAALAGTLFPRVIRLAQLSTAAAQPPSSSVSSATPGSNPSGPSAPVAGATDVEQRALKLELNKQASQLRVTLETLKQQADSLDAGNLSLDDQQWLIDQLERQLALAKNASNEMLRLASLPAATE